MSISRTDRFLGGLAFGYASQAVITLVGLWLTTFLIQRLGETDYGLWLVATRILGYLMLLDLGVVALLPRETAFATGRAGGASAARDLPEIVGRTARIVFLQLPAIAVIALVVWLALPSEWEPLRDPLSVVLVVFVATFPLRVLQAALNGLQDLTYLGAAHTAAWIVGTAVTVALVVLDFGLYSLAIGWALTSVISGVMWWLRLSSRFPSALPRSLPKITGGVLRDRFARSAWISVSQMANVLLQGTDLLIIGKIMGPGAVVPYFCTAKVMTVLAHQPQALAATAQPALSELRASDERHRLVDVTAALTRAILLLSGGIVCVVLAVNEGFVRWWVGEEQFGGFLLTATLLAGMLLRHWNAAAAYSLFAFGRDRRISLTALGTGLVTVAASVLLVYRYGLLGAAIGALVGLVLVGLPANLTGLASELRVSVRGLTATLWPWFWRFALVAALAASSAGVWVPGTVPALALATLGISALYGALMLPLALRDPLGMYVRPRLAALRRIVLRDAAVLDAEA